MRIGVLLCDDLHEGLETHWTSYRAMFEAMLSPAGRVRAWRCHADEWPPDPTECDAWVVSGSRASVYEDKSWIVRLLAFVADAHAAGRSLLGICFGHQVVNAALGGDVARAESGWGLGLHRAAVVEDFGRWRRGEEIALLSVHQDQVARPAPGMRRLATSRFCPNYVTAAPGVLTVQGHPEFDRAFFSALLPRLVEKAGQIRVDRARESLARPDDHDAFRGYACAFLAGEAA
ncbi:type 1 glutamine amidotransferase [Arhodomonas sp. AD133]|uniref:type 1 glutamine amidotransferase n=1 Tax=Arhodomonas sp. AD133 TaxID=3415009 RepID=UPI003EB7CF14